MRVLEETIMTPEDTNSTNPQTPHQDPGTDAVPATGNDRPELIAYRLNSSPPPLVCAPGSRAWMDASIDRFAYRCLPLLIANQAGWFILNEHPFEAMWDGKLDPSGVHIRNLAKEATEKVTSHFGSGVITWHVSYLFRTPPGYNLLARGPSNWPKDGVQALEGLVESDWTSATFTMNWQFTRTQHWVRFDEGEPICMLVPQRRGELEEFRTELRDLKDNPELSEGHTRWSESRSQFLAELQQPGSEAVARKWQKHYFQGRSLDGAAGTRHQTVLTLQPFIKSGEARQQRAGVRVFDNALQTEKEPMATTLRPVRQLDYRLEKLDNEILLYHPAKTRALYLSETASIVWELSNGERTTAEIIDLLREAFPEAAATIGDDVTKTLHTLAEEEAVVLI
jgi:hypothetical protein